MAKNKKRKPKAQVAAPMKPEKYIREHARKLAVHECLVNDNWQDQGMAVVMVCRQRLNGSLLVSSYVVDTFCLGVKDSTFWYKLDMDEYQDLVKQLGRNMGLDFAVCEPQLAYSIVYGAVQYAKDLGFSPHRDFLVTQYVLDPTVPMLDIEFGKDGRPLYIEGPNDNGKAIIRKLTEAVGIDNFEYIADLTSLGINPYGDDDEDEDDEDDDDEDKNDVEDYDGNNDEFATDATAASEKRQKSYEPLRKSMEALQLSAVQYIMEHNLGSPNEFDEYADDLAEEIAQYQKGNHAEVVAAFEQAMASQSRSIGHQALIENFIDYGYQYGSFIFFLYEDYDCTVIN